MSLLVKRMETKYNIKPSVPKIQYPTGFLELDYRIGKKKKVFNMETGEVINTYNSIGLPGGSITTIAGPSGIGKTTLVAQIASHIAEQFPDSYIDHKDIEQTFDITRFQNLSNWSILDVRDKYTLEQDQIFHETLRDKIKDHVQAKLDLSKELTYDTGLLDEFGVPINVMQPSFIILDSLPSLYPSELENEEGMKNYSRFPMEIAKAHNQLFRRVQGLLKAVNVHFIIINHLNDNVDMGVIKKQSKLNYLKADKSVPGGNAPMYYASNFWALSQMSNGKIYQSKGNPFDGFFVCVDIIKCKDNKAGKRIILPYDQVNGYDPIFHIYDLLDRNDFIKGSRNGSYFVESMPSIKIRREKFNDIYNDNEEFRKECLNLLTPILDGFLSQKSEINDTEDDNQNDMESDEPTES